MLFLHPFRPSPQHWRLLLFLCFILMGLFSTKAQDLNTSIGEALPTDLVLMSHQLPKQGSQLAGRYRNQWLQLPEGYQTAQIAYQQRAEAWTWGAQLNRLKAGQDGFQRLQLSTALAYQQQLRSDETSLMLGVEAGLMQHRLGSALTYDQQYLDGFGFDPSVTSGEDFFTDQATHFNWSVALALQGDWVASNLRRWTLSGVADHLHRPALSFTDLTGYWEPRWLLSASYVWPLAPQLLLESNTIYQQQGTQQEWQAGARLGMELTTDSRLWLGVACRFGDAWIMRAGWEEEQVGIWLAYDQTTSSLTKANNGNGAVEVGASFRWSKKRSPQPKNIFTEHPVKTPPSPALADSDGDGVPDQLDKCPLVAGLAVFQGCNDQDQDGVIDPEDSCPTVFGRPDRQGCPWTEKDSDLDGVPDEADYCVFIKGLPSLNGCPDTDGDGVSDIDDQCPFLKGDRATGGCPIKETTVTEEEPLVTQPVMIVEFDTDQDIIVPTFRTLLEEFALRHQQRAGLRVLISGHTDYEGSPAYNVGLGQERALAVQRFLRPLLAAGTRFELLSYGELMPIDSNYTDDGRARNRRAEVRIYLE